jgi:hypothetical protein
MYICHNNENPIPIITAPSSNILSIAHPKQTFVLSVINPTIGSVKNQKEEEKIKFPTSTLTKP